MKLILIRHCLTDYNLKRVYCGSTDTSINKTGRLQAKKIRNKLKDLKIDKVLCSNLKRSEQTAKIIFKGKKCEIVKNPNLREINFGKWESLASKQILDSYPFIYKKWCQNPFKADIPNAEKMAHFTNRIKKEIKKIVKRNTNKTVALVIHGGPIRAILNYILGIKQNNFWRIKLKPQIIYIIEYNNSSKPRVCEL